MQRMRGQSRDGMLVYADMTDAAQQADAACATETPTRFFFYEQTHFDAFKSASQP